MKLSKWNSIGDAASFLCVSESHMRRLVRDGYFFANEVRLLPGTEKKQVSKLGLERVERESIERAS